MLPNKLCECKNSKILYVTSRFMLTILGLSLGIIPLRFYLCVKDYVFFLEPADICFQISKLCECKNSLFCMFPCDLCWRFYVFPLPGWIIVILLRRYPPAWMTMYYFLETDDIHASKYLNSVNVIRKFYKLRSDSFAMSFIPLRKRLCTCIIFLNLILYIVRASTVKIVQRLIS
jgi:hypothetical protein